MDKETINKIIGWIGRQPWGKVVMKEITKRKIEEYKIARDKMYGDNGREESDCYLQDMIEWLDKGEEIDRCYKRSIK